MGEVTTAWMERMVWLRCGDGSRRRRKRGLPWKGGDDSWVFGEKNVRVII